MTPSRCRITYSLLSYFNNTEKEAERSNPQAPGSIRFIGSPMKLENRGADEQRKELEGQLAAVNRKLAARTALLAKGSAPDNAAAIRQSRQDLHVLKPATFTTESDAENELQADGSVLLTGPVPKVDTYTFEAELPAGPFTGMLIETLTHASLPGSGPGRGDAARPNFVVKRMEVTLTAPGAKPEPLRFDSALASFSQSNFPVESLLDEATTAGWAINPQFHQPHWAAFGLDKPRQIAAGTRLTVRLVQDFGSGRVIGCLRVSSISGDVLAVLPAPQVVAETPDEQAALPKGKARRRAAAKAATPVPSDPELAQLQRQKTALDRKIAALQPQTSEVMRELPEPRMSTIFKRGVYTDPGDPVQAGTPAVLNPAPAGPPNRLTLARWLVSKDNPLTARVTVNRWWAELFGHGIVTTVEDFGIKGEPPTHPELLDWLAVDFMEHGWSMKSVLKKIVMSAAYRQSSAVTPGLLARDDRNLLYARGPRVRLDAEAVRDNALRIAGLLSTKQGGPPIRPPQPDGLWTKVGGQNYNYVVSPGEDKYRRGLYVVLKRGSPYPSFVNFDAGARMACVVKRSRSNTPLQALTLLNDPVYVEAAESFARRVVTETPDQDVAARIRHAWRIALSREPSSNEVRVLENLWQAQSSAAASSGTKASGKDGLTASEFKAWTAVATAILNLDETITKG